jgi:hypothetical protein
MTGWGVGCMQWLGDMVVIPNCVFHVNAIALIVLESRLLEYEEERATVRP